MVILAVVHGRDAPEPKPLCADGWDAGKPCVRVEAVCREYEQWRGGLDKPAPGGGWAIRIRNALKVADQWGPRLSEFEPCSDCGPCLARAEEEEAWEDHQDWRKVHRWKGNMGVRLQEDDAAQCRKQDIHDSLQRVFGRGR